MSIPPTRVPYTPLLSLHHGALNYHRVETRSPYDKKVLANFSCSFTRVSSVSPRVAKPTRPTRPILSNHLMTTSSSRFRSSLLPPPGSTHPIYRPQTSQKLGESVKVRRFNWLQETWMPPSQGILKRKRAFELAIISYEIYMVSVPGTDGRANVDDFNSLFGEIANDDGSFPDMTVAEVMANRRGHHMVYAFLPYNFGGNPHSAWTPARILEASRGLVRVCPFVGPSRHREFTVGRHRLLHWNAATAPALLNIGYDVIDDSGSFMANDKRDPLLDLTDYLL